MAPCLINRFGPQLILEVIADGLALAVRVRREIDGLRLLGFLFQLTNELLFAFDDLIMRFEIVVDVNG